MTVKTENRVHVHITLHPDDLREIDERRQIGAMPMTEGQIEAALSKAVESLSEDFERSIFLEISKPWDLGRSVLIDHDNGPVSIGRCYSDRHPDESDT